MSIFSHRNIHYFCAIFQRHPRIVDFVELISCLTYYGKMLGEPIVQHVKKQQFRHDYKITHTRYEKHRRIRLCGYKCMYALVRAVISKRQPTRERYVLRNASSLSGVALQLINPPTGSTPHMSTLTFSPGKTPLLYSTSFHPHRISHSSTNLEPSIPCRRSFVKHELLRTHNNG